MLAMTMIATPFGLAMTSVAATKNINNKNKIKEAIDLEFKKPAKNEEVDKTKKKVIGLIQCRIVKQGCSGFHCSYALKNKESHFNGYPGDLMVVTFECQCPGTNLSRLIRHMKKKVVKRLELNEEDVVLHLSSCMTKDNFHFPPCPHLPYIREILDKRGIDYIEGTHISPKAEKRRQEGIWTK